MCASSKARYTRDNSAQCCVGTILENTSSQGDEMLWILFAHFGRTDDELQKSVRKFVSQ